LERKRKEASEAYVDVNLRKDPQNLSQDSQSPETGFDLDLQNTKQEW
jgi:hypothetical protein